MQRQQHPPDCSSLTCLIYTSAPQLDPVLGCAGRFKARFERCKARFEEICIGPARAGQQERMGRAERRERSRFVHDYNDRLFNGLVIASLAEILLFRFVIRSSLLETLGWLAFAFLQVGRALKLADHGSLLPALLFLARTFSDAPMVLGLLTGLLMTTD